LYSRLNTFRCTEETCSFCLSSHAGCRAYGKYYNAAAIPPALAEEVAKHVDATRFLKNIGLLDAATVTAEDVAQFDEAMAA
jgi:hypothetical protein